jgi:formate hydrogenlyase subunit 3/multisubunit Na+/H+ antiporter MnhD subunit
VLHADGHDLKRLFAYHGREHRHHFIGLGLGLAFAANTWGPAALATTAALFHVFTTGVQSLLFFGSGVLTATGERDMERLRD